MAENETNTRGRKPQPILPVSFFSFYHLANNKFLSKMKREGRQHGMVRTYGVLPLPYNPRPSKSRFINRFDSPPTAGMFTRVQQKPTNHSKFSGKCCKPRCPECHLQPCSKSKDKTKGSQKSRSRDVLNDYRLVSWRVVDGRLGLMNFSGLSAARILDHLDNDYLDDEYMDDHDNDDDQVCDDVCGAGPSGGVEIQEIVDDEGNNDKLQDHDEEIIQGNQAEENGDEEEDDMGFCDVGFVLDQVEGDEDWCLVAELM